MRPTPKTPRTKTFLHTLHLVLPMIQFLALMGMVAIFSRCSPLASSTAKQAGTQPSVQTQAEGSDNANINKAITEDQIQAQLKPLGTSEAQIILDADFNSKRALTLQSDSSITAAMLGEQVVKKDISAKQASPRLTIHISKDQIDTLMREGILILDLSQHLASNDKAIQKNLFADLKASLDSLDIDASSYLIFSEKALISGYSQAKLSIDIAVAITGDNSGVMELHRDTTNQNQQNAALLGSAIRDAKELAIVLE